MSVRSAAPAAPVAPIAPAAAAGERQLALLSWSFLADLPGTAQIHGTAGRIDLGPPFHAPETCAVTRFGVAATAVEVEAGVEMEMGPGVVRFPLPALSEGERYNYGNGQGMAYEAIAVRFSGDGRMTGGASSNVPRVQASQQLAAAQQLALGLPTGCSCLLCAALRSSAHHSLTHPRVQVQEAILAGRLECAECPLAESLAVLRTMDEARPPLSACHAPKLAATQQALRTVWRAAWRLPDDRSRRAAAGVVKSSA